MGTGYKVADLMNQNVITATHTMSMKEAAKLMHEKDIGSLLVKDDTSVKGIITEQDFVRKIVAVNRSPSTTSVMEVMTTNVVDISPLDDVYDAMLLMAKHNFTHLPVVQNGNLVGIISFKDILKVEPAIIEKINSDGL